MAAKKRKRQAPSTPPPAEPASIESRMKPLVFISHDSRDAKLAEAFSILLAEVSGGTLKSFCSSGAKGAAGIPYGEEWYGAVMSQLGNATDVVALFTERSLERPWILYEAGVAKGKLGVRVLGIALGIPLARTSSGPFGQFQNCADDDNALTDLVMQLLSRVPNAAPMQESVRKRVGEFLQRVNEIAATPVKTPAVLAVDANLTARLFEEIKVMVRELTTDVRVVLKKEAPRFPSASEAVSEFVFHPEDRHLEVEAIEAVGRVYWELRKPLGSLLFAIRKNQDSQIRTDREKLVLALRAQSRNESVVDSVGSRLFLDFAQALTTANASGAQIDAATEVTPDEQQ
jgi:hypothetical protein